ncbi:MAG: 4-aminobutyrate aminotransferase [marine bacterium B5-7]|nr:MAG: 4-aminobutyrate aminotransferase [marine bacterium B5-7]
MITADRAANLAREYFAIDGEATPLDGERDLNFRIDTASARYVLKAYAGINAVASLDLQDHVLSRLAEMAPQLTIPKLQLSVDGQMRVIVDVDDQQYTLRCLTWLNGNLWSNADIDQFVSPYNLGRYLARLDNALAKLPQDAMPLMDASDSSAIVWNMRHAGRYIDETWRVEPLEFRTRIESILMRFKSDVVPALDRLPLQIIHNDANDNNIVVEDNGNVMGLIDFGDVVVGQRVIEIAIACAYAMCGKDNPLAVAALIVSGYNSAAMLDENEIALIFDLIETRITMSIVIGVLQHAAQPDNDYLLVSQRPFRLLLDRLEAENRELAHYRLRDACGLHPHPSTQHVIRWLQRHRSTFASVCDYDLSNESNLLILDLTIDSEHAKAMHGLNTTGELSDALFGLMDRAGCQVGIGRYFEKRTLYSSPAYQTGSPSERRDRHLGIDVFIAAGEPIYAPLDGTVDAIANNDQPLDFGPVVILRHATDDGTPFWTLYGHLSLNTLKHLTVGQTVRRGETIGWVGDYPINGDWPPHLHFQIMTSLLDMGTAIHGVGNDALLEVFTGVFPDPALILPLSVFTQAPVIRSPEALHDRRRIRLGQMLSLAYQKPLKIIRGEGQYLFDESGTRFLDMVNNVCHVGHCHPRVVAAGQRQMATLNTNTRYLHDHIIELSERLTTLLPDPLSVCFFVNSGSEANDLALRLARAHTGRRDIIALEKGYHGHTSSLIDISAYKFDGPGGSGCPSDTHICPLPDTYRGVIRRDDPDPGAAYATHVKDCLERLESRHTPPAAFIAESLGGVSGQIILPDGYLDTVYEYVRNAGGLCIADEVQVGLGRMGKCWWGFETQGVVPDIVTIGKPLGNGHPIAAVVTTAGIAASFETGMEYFNTFGGNPVSCTVALAVLDSVVIDGLMENAANRGHQLLTGLTELAERHPLIGDVRGIGLFVGAELVVDRKTLEPATKQAAALVEYMKQRGILLSTDGAFNNTLKIKPPLCINSDDIAYFLECLDDGLEHLTS